jgi:hypothetical protein
MKFHTTILQGGKTTTGIEVPPEVVEALRAGKRPPVKVTINGATYRSSIAVMGGRYMVGVSAENRALTGVAGGDEVDVDVELDTEKREVTVPQELAEALGRSAEAKRFFDGLSYSKQLWFVLQVTGAKTAETRQRRVDKVIGMLAEGKTP